MPSNNYTIAIKAEDGQLRKITKILFGRDGSYMVMVPYHSSKHGTLFKLPIRISPTLHETDYYHQSAIIDGGDIDEKRVKLSHHLSGLVQFSGEGVISGFDDLGNPRGIGLKSWALDNPAPGPSFGIMFFGLHDFKLATSGEVLKLDSDWIVFDVNDLPPAPGNGFALEGFYFPPKARRFLKYTGGKPCLQIVHPVGIVMDLKVALSDPTGCDFPGLIGITVYPMKVKIETYTSGYIIASSTSSLRKNEKGEWVSDGLYCVFPDEMRTLARRNLDYLPVSPSQPLASGTTTEIKKKKSFLGLLRR